jgi:hydroxymethylglutaryl-CoA lyase
MRKYPKIEYVEEVMRDGLQIQDASISVDDKLRLLNALGKTGLKHIDVGSFVSPRWVPQMACMDELMQRFKPQPGVIYSTHLLNQRGLERARQYLHSLTLPPSIDFGYGQDLRLLPTTSFAMCDVFTRRNINRSHLDAVASWPGIVARAKERGDKEARISLGSTWGSNWVGGFSLKEQMQWLERQHQLWEEVGIKVVACGLWEGMSWNTPTRVEETLLAVKNRWPEITEFHFHIHNARGMAIVSAYATLRALGPEDTVTFEGSVGGIGGCPYCGDGRATGMMPTEDFMHMLEGMGIETGVDLDKIIDCVWLLEKIIGYTTFGHVSKAGPRPVSPDKWYPMDMPFIESFEQAKHFKLGPKVYEGCLFPWKETIQSPQRLEREKAWRGEKNEAS